MSIANEITRLQTARNAIRAKLVALGLVDNAAKIDSCAEAIEGIEDKGAVTATVKEGETFKIPKGYHNGSGTVAGVAGGGNYTLQEKSVTPTKSPQNVTPDEGYFGLAAVTVGVIPAEYQVVTDVTAAAGDVLAGKVIVTKDGTVTAGTMTNHNGVSETIDGMTTLSYTIPKGYHNGTGKVTMTNDIEEALAAI